MDKIIFGMVGSLISCIGSGLIYLVYFHHTISVVSDDIKDIKHAMKTIEKCVPHLDQLPHKKHDK